MNESTEIDDVFFELLKVHIDDLRGGELPKGKFIGKYIPEIRKRLEEGDFDHKYKRPQVIGEGNDSDNNWLDHILNMEENEFLEFRKTILNHEN